MLFRRPFDLFDEMFSDPFFTAPFETAGRSSLMKTDIQEKDGSYVIDMELPGYSKEDIQAELKDGYLTISANHTENKDEKDNQGKYLRRERFQGTCKRTFYVGEDIRQEDIKAAFQNGVLRLAVPKQAPQVPEKEQPKLIEIQ
ncbi:Hsp20/alpha crystallin family protein [Lactonifactor longoviformis]|uniref:Heat shock protein Hsp20 n=1 Tax=Lactonifactor longoviformis DSM 17459 TaxID=1122155 RepID=A0A1M4VEN1_9CLOT|nr:Hsp20/alpha crystallin family protein [Lactonifactor longoviformis]POP30270.1 Hsp20/alpha crystallin family protein [Lactonifactor longoviformis]SHE67446.1 heat shock protein Hsp20 [Lactonifactor longoviformis DSM 17459]